MSLFKYMEVSVNKSFVMILELWTKGQKLVRNLKIAIASKKNSTIYYINGFYLLWFWKFSSSLKWIPSLDSFKNSRYGEPKKGDYFDDSLLELLKWYKLFFKLYESLIIHIKTFEIIAKILQKFKNC